MRTVAFQSVLDWVATKMLGAPSQMRAEEALEYGRHLHDAAREAWERAAWPEWTPVEQRWFRPFWDIGESYAIGDEVYYEQGDAYYQCVLASVGDVPGQSAKWQVLDSGNQEEDPIDDLDTHISLDQEGETPIGTVLRVTLEDPRQSYGTRDLTFWMGPNGIQVPRGSATSVWVTFRKRPPQFTGEAYASGTAYAIGDVVYYATTGECYVKLTSAAAGTVPTNTTAWQKQDFPYVLASYARRLAYAEALETDGQGDKSPIQRALAEEELAMEWSKAEAQQNQTRRFAVDAR